MQEEKRIMKLLKDYQNFDMEEAIYNHKIKNIMLENDDIISATNFIQWCEGVDEGWKGFG